MARIKTIIVSRTDNIGDVILTLPAIHFIRQKFPGVRIILLAKNYVKAIAEAAQGIDEFIAWETLQNVTNEKAIALLRSYNAEAIIHAFPRQEIAKLAKKANIPLRIAYINKRLKYLLFYCNRLYPFSSRRRSYHHEAIRNILLLKKLGIKTKPSMTTLIPFVELIPKENLTHEFTALIDYDKFNIIFHPGSNGNGQEWPAKYFVELYHLLPKNKFRIFITGNDKERLRFTDTLIKQCPEAINLTAKMNLTQLLCFIKQCDGLVAASTGPLHIAAALGIQCLGLFPPRRQMDLRCWQPIGKNAEYLVPTQKCQPCQRKQKKLCCCTSQILPEEVAAKIKQWAPQETIRCRKLA